MFMEERRKEISEAIEKNGKITISTSLQKNDCILSVTDTGIGIPRADIPKLFKRFSQGTSHKRTCSTGLGLYLSRQIVEAHNGKIWVETELNKGCTFKFELKHAIVENRVLI